MIDLHLHLLPAIDDGAATIEISRAMIERAREVGFETLVATPHLDGPLPADYRERVAAAWQRVASIAAEYGIQVGLGYENKLTPDLVRRLDAGEPVTLGGGKTVLVELPFAGWPNFTRQSLFELQAAGYRPLLAHPERYVDAHDDIDRLFELADLGVPLQVTFGSLTGLFGKRVQQIAEQLLQRDATAILATDAHSAGHRFETVERGYDRARALVGSARLAQLVTDNPRALLDDQPLPLAAHIEPESGAGNGWKSALKRFGRRS